MSIARQFGKGGLIGDLPKGKATIVDEKEAVFGKNGKPKTKKEIADLAKAVAAIEAKPPKKKRTDGDRAIKSAEQPAAAKKGRPKKGEAVTKLVPVTVMVDPDLASIMKSGSGWQDIARLALKNAFLLPLNVLDKKS